MSIRPINRDEQLDKVNETIVNSRKKLSAIVSNIGWSIESISKDVENMVNCPFDGSHNVPENSLGKHLQTCQWKAEGYGMLDLPLSGSSLPPGAPSSIKFDEQLQNDVIQSAKLKNPSMAIGGSGRLIPRTSDRFVAEFTREEKCAMYEYVIANTVEPDIGKDIADMNKPKASGNAKTSSYLELLAQERNLKRRRAKYRGVHTNKKSQIEILRQVINQQMEMLSEYITERNYDTFDFVTDNLVPKEDVHGYEEINKTTEIGHSHAASSGLSIVCQTFLSNINHRVQYQENCSRISEDRFVHRGSSNDRGRSNGSRDSYGKTGQSMEINHYSKERDQRDRRVHDSDEQRSHKSHRTTHREKSMNRHEKKRNRSKSRERRRSRERELLSRSSRDPKHEDQRSKSARYLQYDDRRKKKKSVAVHSR